MTAGVDAQQPKQSASAHVSATHRTQRARVRKQGLVKLHVEAGALVHRQDPTARTPSSQPGQPPRRRPTPVPVFRTPPPRVDSATCCSTYTVKRFLVTKYDGNEDATLPHPLESPGEYALPPGSAMDQLQGQLQGQLHGQLQGQLYGQLHGQLHGQLQEHQQQADIPDRAKDHVAHPNGGVPQGDPANHRSSLASRRSSVYPTASASSSSFPEDEEQGKCCFTIMCGKWRRCASVTATRIMANPLCPSTTWLTRFVAMVIIGLLFLGTAILVIGGNGWFQIISAVVLAQLVGIFLHKATSLPPLLGMLLVGVCVRQLGYIDYFSARHEALIYIARSFSLVVLMVRTGFRLDTEGVRSLSPLMVGLAIVPPIVEFACVSALASLVLGMSPPFALLSGIIMAAACPKILMPCFSMMGAGRSVQSVLVAVACLNDMIVIVAFGIVMAFIFSFAGDTLPYALLHRIMGVGCGVLLGIVCGLFIRYVPDRHDPQVMSIRSVMMGSVGLFSILGFAKIGFFGGGPAACIVAAYMSSRGWRAQGWGPDYRGNPVATVFDVLWRIMQPVMFCLMGADLELTDTSYTSDKLLISIAVLVSAWLVRIVVSMAVLAYGDLSIKERLYVTLAWVPKAGVQAALCPLALDQARYRGDRGDILKHSRDVMLLVLLAVVITAPLVAALTSRRGLVNVLLPSRRASTVSRPSHLQHQSSVCSTISTTAPATTATTAPATTAPATTTPATTAQPT